MNKITKRSLELLAIRILFIFDFALICAVFFLNYLCFI